MCQVLVCKQETTMQKSVEHPYRTYLFYYKFKPKKVTHRVDAPEKVMNFMEKEWKAAGLSFTRLS